MAISSIHTGWHFDRGNTRLDVYYQGTRAGHFNASGLSLTGALTVTGNATIAGTSVIMSGLPTAACCLACGQLWVCCCCCTKTVRIV